ncbi:hypothetical protein PPERSA_09623 [Pseudocohnilembus persalinus]|uniref:Tubulin-tyrosine ligase family protein n=1 Tax=Pseudocohnilembus persalinus TaxID=266149 RepID=A0A0V0QFN5_PSEPJ|nr:hypothetical protein PPERSA_09623 [Pseudocohnilembus persalinus]|eukprot:KRX01017.1 hypothetical protein PPERSA_09623 [Pseudocohnilembus persalinus]
MSISNDQYQTLQDKLEILSILTVFSGIHEIAQNPNSFQILQIQFKLDNQLNPIITDIQDINKVMNENYNYQLESELQQIVQQALNQVLKGKKFIQNQQLQEKDNVEQEYKIQQQNQSFKMVFNEVHQVYVDDLEQRDLYYPKIIQEFIQKYDELCGVERQDLPVSNDQLKQEQLDKFIQNLKVNKDHNKPNKKKYQILTKMREEPIVSAQQIQDECQKLKDQEYEDKKRQYEEQMNQNQLQKLRSIKKNRIETESRVALKTYNKKKIFKNDQEREKYRRKLMYEGKLFKPNSNNINKSQYLNGQNQKNDQIFTFDKEKNAKQIFKQFLKYPLNKMDPQYIKQVKNLENKQREASQNKHDIKDKSNQSLNITKNIDNKYEKHLGIVKQIENYIESNKLQFFKETQTFIEKNKEIKNKSILQGRLQSSLKGSSLLQSKKNITENFIVEYDDLEEIHVNLILSGPKLSLKLTGHFLEKIHKFDENINTEFDEGEYDLTHLNHKQQQNWIKYGKGYKQYRDKIAIIQKYIENPFLINNKKFDVRCYVLVAQVEPFLVFFHHGYLRLSLNEYTTLDSQSVMDQNLQLTHLTNAAIQKNHPDYQSNKDDSIWSMEQFQEYLIKTEKVSDKQQIESIYDKMKQILKYTFLAGQSKLSSKKGCFELLGVDFMFDQDLNPFLIEINTNPALTLA